MQAAEDQFAGRRIGRESTKVGYYRSGTAAGHPQFLAALTTVQVPGRGDEVEFRYEGALALAQHDQHLARAARDLRRAAGAWQSHLRRAVVANHSGVEIAEAIDLGGSKKADVDTASLQPIGENLRDRNDGVRGLGQLSVADRKRQYRRFRAYRARLVNQHRARRMGEPRQIG